MQYGILRKQWQGLDKFFYAFFSRKPASIYNPEFAGLLVGGNDLATIDYGVMYNRQLIAVYFRI